ncbi:MAG: VanZ family protein [Bacteroidales bacterium]|nr:VanZ family protein [Bacteroidales bacterium]
MKAECFLCKLIRQQWRALVWVVFILIITGIPGSYIPEVVTFWDWIQPDKVVHIAVFGVLSFLILYNARTQYLESSRRYLYVVVAVGMASSYGLLTEVLQRDVFVGRSGNVYDVLADILGAGAGWLVFRWLQRKKIWENNQPNIN